MINLDSANSLGSIKELDKQCLDAWRQSSNLNFNSITPVSMVTIAGMGGSLYSYYFVTSLFGDKLKMPVNYSNSYHLPNYLTKSSLVLASTYSGSTEETLSCANEALQKGIKLTGITSGGKLKDLLEEEKLTSYIFNPIHNPSNQPRMGQGYMIFGTLGILKSLGVVDLSTEEVEKSVKILNHTDIKKAKDIADKLFNKVPFIVSSDFLYGNIHALRNQFNENSKQLSDYHLIPEMNHHLMEGLSFPEEIKKNLTFLFINSRLFDEKIQKRIKLTEEVVAKNKIDTLEIYPQGETKLEQSLSLLQFGSYVTYYLALLNNVDPNKIPWVDYFKKNL